MSNRKTSFTILFNATTVNFKENRGLVEETFIIISYNKKMDKITTCSKKGCFDGHYYYFQLHTDKEFFPYLVLILYRYIYIVTLTTLQ